MRAGRTVRAMPESYNGRAARATRVGWSLLPARVLAALLTCALLGAVIPRVSRADDAAPTPVPAAVYVIRRGWHVDVGFATSEVGESLAPVAARFPGARYLIFGFGDQKYLLARRHSPPVLSGALWPGAGLMLVTGLAVAPAEAFGAAHVVALELPSDGVERVRAFVRKTFTDPGQPRAPGPYEGSLFYDAAVRYSALHTCNTWVAQALAAAPLPVRERGVVFAGQVWRQVRGIRR